jgi:anti-sigma factor RsiW
MNQDAKPIGEDDLHAYIDGQLPLARRGAVEDYLRTHPEAGRRIDAYHQDRSALREAASAHLSTPVPLRLRMTEVRRLQRARLLAQGQRIAAGVVLFAIGVSVGWLAGPRSPVQMARAPMDDALTAYRVFAQNPGPDIETAGGEQPTLVSRMTGHLGHEIAIPNLSSLGLTFLGGRLLASDDGPGGMFIYTNPGGQRLAIYVKTVADRRDASARMRRAGDVMVYYWFTRQLGYAIVGPDSPFTTSVGTVVQERYR